MEEHYMARVNGENFISIQRIDLREMAEKILNISSPDGKGINMVLTPEEEAWFRIICPSEAVIGDTIASFIQHAVQKRNPNMRIEELKYTYNIVTRTFITT